jgi:uncharacterized protein YcfL
MKKLIVLSLAAVLFAGCAANTATRTNDQIKKDADKAFSHTSDMK